MLTYVHQFCVAERDNTKLPESADQRGNLGGPGLMQEGVKFCTCQPTVAFVSAQAGASRPKNASKLTLLESSLSAALVR